MCSNDNVGRVCAIGFKHRHIFRRVGSRFLFLAHIRRVPIVLPEIRAGPFCVGIKRKRNFNDFTLVSSVVDVVQFFHNSLWWGLFFVRAHFRLDFFRRLRYFFFFFFFFFTFVFVFYINQILLLYYICINTLLLLFIL